MKLGKKLLRIVSCVTDVGKYIIGEGKPPLSIQITQHDENAPSELDDILETPSDHMEVQVEMSGNPVTTAVLMFMYMTRQPEVMQCMKVLIAVAADADQAEGIPEVRNTVDAMLRSVEKTFKHITGREYPAPKDDGDDHKFKNIRNSAN